jgi:predicted site-specific integrase-resolvase
MKYNIEHIIKGLEKAKKAGKVVIDEKELIRIATPQINDIDRQIRLIESGMKKDIKIRYPFVLTYNTAENLTGIPRKTLYEWEKQGIIERKNGYHTVVNLEELRNKLIKIKNVRE